MSNSVGVSWQFGFQGWYLELFAAFSTSISRYLDIYSSYTNNNEGLESFW